MKLFQNKETGEYKTFYSGKDVIIALGRKFQDLAEVLKENYNDELDIFDHKDAITKIPLFKDEEEFKAYLGLGTQDMYEAEIINKYKFKDENDKIIKIETYNELKNVRQKIKKNTSIGIDTILTYISIICFGIYFIFKIL